MNKNIKILLYIVGYIICYVIGTYVFDNYYPKKNLCTIGKTELIKMEQIINEYCPVMVDKDTRFDKATSNYSKKVFQYYYTLIDTSKNDINIKEFEKYKIAMVITKAKTDNAIKNFFKNNITLIYNFKDKNGVHFSSIVIKPSDVGYNFAKNH